MTHIIENAVPYPLDCEVRLGSVMASLLMSLRRDVPDGMAICTSEHRKKGEVGEPCIRCGGCRGWTAAEKLYFALANEYAFVSGQALLQFDMSGKDAGTRDEIRVLDQGGGDTIDFLFAYAGYTQESLYASAGKEAVFAAIRALIDREVPVLLQYQKNGLWLLVTGYGDGQTLYGYDGGGYAEYYARMDPAPEAYEGKLFRTSHWFEAMQRVVIVGDAGAPTVTLRDALRRNATLMKRIFDNDYYGRAAEYIQADDYYRDEGDNLRNQAQLINDFIGVPIGGRSIVSWFLFDQLAHGCDAGHRGMFERMAGCCCDIHEICWVAWRGVGAYEPQPERFATRLTDPLYRKMLAGVVRLVGYKDRQIYESLRDYAARNV